MNLATAHQKENEFGEVETNDVVIRSYTTFGALHALGKVEVEAREALIPDRNHAAYFVKISVESSGEYPQIGTTLIAYENINKLANAIKKLESIVIKTDRFKFSEVEYDVDGIRIIAFNDPRGKMMFVVTCEGVSAHFNPLSRLSELRELIMRAKAHLDRHKIDI